MNQELAKQFFSSLYEDTPTELKGNFDAMATKLVAKSGETLVSGDQALQSLMINYILSSQENVEKGKDIVAALGHIKQRSVNDFTSKFPNTNLEDLIAAAEKSGFDVSILKF